MCVSKLKFKNSLLYSVIHYRLIKTGNKYNGIHAPYRNTFLQYDYHINSNNCKYSHQKCILFSSHRLFEYTTYSNNHCISHSVLNQGLYWYFVGNIFCKMCPFATKQILSWGAPGLIITWASWCLNQHLHCLFNSFFMLTERLHITGL